MVTAEQILNALVKANVIGAWEVEYDGALFIRGVAEEIDGQGETWAVTISPNGEVD